MGTRSDAGARGKRGTPQPGHQRTAQLRCRQPRAGESGGDDEAQNDQGFDDGPDDDAGEEMELGGFEIPEPPESSGDLDEPEAPEAPQAPEAPKAPQDPDDDLQ